MTRKKSKKRKINSTQLKSVILNHFLKRPKKRFTPKQIIRSLKLDVSIDAVKHAMKELAKDGSLYEIESGRYKLDRLMKLDKVVSSRPTKTYVGKVDLTRSGSAYIISDESELDIYVPGRYVAGAYDGDIVEVTVPVFSGRRKLEGKITKILERKTTHLMGILRKFKRYATVIPLIYEKNPEVNVKLNEVTKIEDGKPVVVEITDWGQSQNKALWGRVTKELDYANDSDLAMQDIIFSNGFEIEFPAGVLREVADLPTNISQQEIDRRRDFREVTTFTIDPLTAKDFDDALSIEYLENDWVEIGIHIADVTHYVKEGSLLDKEALERSTSVYLVDRVVPMLPEKISNDLCSLNPQEDKLVFSAAFKFDEKWRMQESWFGKAVIHSDKRFVYEEAQEIIDAGKGPFYKELTLLNNLAKRLRKKRFKQGSLAFDSDEVFFKLDEEGVPVEVMAKERKDTNLLVEDFMLLANRKVAEYIKKKSNNEIPFVYRIHDSPDPEKLNDFAWFAGEMGFEIRTNTPKEVAESFNRLNLEIEKRPELKLLEPLAIRTMAKAVYSTDNIGHYGLAFEDYTHFTSPIRRYADVLVHRILERNLNAEYRVKKDTLETKCNHISNQEKKATNAERESIKYKQVEFIQRHLGEEMEGTISGIIDRGLFVMLNPSQAEGMVAFSTLSENYQVADSRLYAISRRSKHTFKIGQKIQVKVLQADLDLRQIELELVE